MNREQLKHTIHGQYGKLKKNARKILPAFDAEVIHQFRVSYKKSRAFSRMISVENGKDRQIKIPGKLKKIYHVLGSIRDLFLQQQRTLEASREDQHTPQSYLNLLQQEIERLKSILSEILLKKPFYKSKKKLDALIPDEFTDVAFKEYMKNKWVAISAIISSENFSDTTIHTIRKNLKDLFYNLKIFRPGDNDTVSALLWNGKDEPYFTTLLDDLGNFQDKSMAIALIKPGWIKSLHILDRQQLERIKKQWMKEKALVKKSLLNKLHVDFAQAAGSPLPTSRQPGPPG